MYFMHILGGPIQDDMKKTQVAEYVVVHPNKLDPLQQPFWVAQVLENDRKGKRLHVSTIESKNQQEAGCSW
jgi:hypothetical protein